jgi:DNA polymerase III sliding clamp (beta) subunit (PCNA family)
VARAAKPNHQSPALQGILLECQLSDHKLLLRATDGIVEISAHVQCESLSESISEPGKLVCIPAAALQSYLKNLKPGLVSLGIDLSEMKATVSQGRSKHIIALIPTDDFPKLESENLEVIASAEIPQGVLSNASTLTLFSVGLRGDGCLNGVNLSLRDGKLVFTSSDARRCSEYLADTPTEKLVGDISVVLPQTVLRAAAAMSEEVPAEIKVLGKNGQEKIVSCTMSTGTISGSLYGGIYPMSGFNKVWAVPREKVVEANCKELLESLRRIALLADKETMRGVWEISEGEIRLEAESPSGKAIEVVSAQASAGSALRFGLSIVYAIQALDKLANSPDDRVLISVGTARDAVIFRSASPDSDYRHLILPMKSN